MWYVLHVKTGKELAVRDSLLAHGIIARVPQEMRSVRKGGEWQPPVPHILIPGYVFVHTEITAERYYRIKATPNILRILVTDNTPAAPTYLEAERLQLLCGRDGAAIEQAVAMITDGGIEVTSGALQYFTNEITKIDKHARKVTVELEIGGEAKQLQLTYRPPGEDGADTDTPQESGEQLPDAQGD